MRIKTEFEQEFELKLWKKIARKIRDETGKEFASTRLAERFQQLQEAGFDYEAAKEAALKEAEAAEGNVSEATDDDEEADDLAVESPSKKPVGADVTEVEMADAELTAVEDASPVKARTDKTADNGTEVMGESSKKSMKKAGEKASKTTSMKTTGTAKYPPLSTSDISRPETPLSSISSIPSSPVVVHSVEPKTADRAHVPTNVQDLASSPTSKIHPLLREAAPTPESDKARRNNNPHAHPEPESEHERSLKVIDISQLPADTPAKARGSNARHVEDQTSLRKRLGTIKASGKPADVLQLSYYDDDEDDDE